MSIEALRAQLRGPQGVQKRIEEIQQRAGVDSFASRLEAAGAPVVSGAVAPRNPFGDSIRPSANTVQLQAMADGVARREGVDPKLLRAIIETESGWNPLAVSNKGAQGLSQLMPDTARELGVTSPLDPEQNLTGGARYLKQMLAKFSDPNLAVAAYNAGPGAVSKYGGIPPFAETQAYVKRVMERYGR